MRKRRAFLLVMFGALMLALSAAVALAQGGEATATADLEDADGNPVGEAEFVEGPNGVTINVNIRQGQQALDPGEYGIHIHETGDITPDFEAAGEHFNPTNAQHGFSNPEGPHAGDLENITINQDGTSTYTTRTDRITLSRGERSILDSDGSALVIHSAADDYETDPSGESGDRLVAGVIESSRSSEPLPSSGGISLLPAATIAALAGGGLLIGVVLLVRRLRLIS